MSRERLAAWNLSDRSYRSQASNVSCGSRNEIAAVAAESRRLLLSLWSGEEFLCDLQAVLYLDGDVVEEVLALLERWGQTAT